MIFELSHENIRTALEEYMLKRNILQGKPFNFYIKTSRKGIKTSRAVIETLEDTVKTDDLDTQLQKPPLIVLPATNRETCSSLSVDFKESAESELEEGIKGQPFKKLFA